MVGKFAIFLLVALCAVQGNNAQSDYFDEHQSQTRSAISDVIDAIKGIVSKIESALGELLGDIPNLLKNLREKIDEIIASIDISGIITKIEDKIEGILGSAGIDISDARDCLDAEKASVTALVEKTQASIAECKKRADDSAADLEAEIEELRTKAKDLNSEILGGIDECIKEAGINPIKFLSCLKGHLEAITGKANVLLKQIKDTIVTANKVAADIVLTLTKCVAKINGDLISGQIAIVNEFKTCVDQIKP